MQRDTRGAEVLHAQARGNPRPPAAMTTAAAPTLRDKQRSALESLLALNAASSYMSPRLHVSL
jgi:hypothetical protein